MSKKSFTGTDLAKAFILTPEEPEPQGTAEEPLKREPQQAPTPLYFEAKSKRVQLLIKPSVYAKAKEKAQSMGLSFNEYVNRLLEKETEV